MIDACRRLEDSKYSVKDMMQAGENEEPANADYIDNVCDVHGPGEGRLEKISVLVGYFYASRPSTMNVLLI